MCEHGVQIPQLVAAGDDVAQPERCGVIGADGEHGPGDLRVSMMRTDRGRPAASARRTNRLAPVVGVTGLDDFGIGIDHRDGDGLGVPFASAQRAALLASPARAVALKSCRSPLRPLTVWRTSPMLGPS